MKKAICLAAGFGLSVAMLTGCGTPKIEDLVDKMYETEMESYTADVSFDVNINVKADGSKMPIKASGSATIEQQGNSLDDVTAHIDGSVKYDLLGFMKDSNDFEAYVVVEDEEATAYYSLDGDDWYYETAEIDDSEIDEKLMSKLMDASKEYWCTGTVDKKMKEVSGEKCYVITIDGTAADMKPIVDVLTKNVDEFEELLDEADVDFEDVAECFPVKMTAYVSKANGYMVACDVDMSGADMDTLLEEMDADDVEISVDSLVFSVTYSNINNTEVSVDKKVTKNAVEASYGGYSDFDYDYDDYDYDDYDYDDYDDDYDYYGDDYNDYGSGDTLEDALDSEGITSEDLSAIFMDPDDDTFYAEADVYGNTLYVDIFMDDSEYTKNEIKQAYDIYDGIFGDPDYVDTMETTIDIMATNYNITDTVAINLSIYFQSNPDEIVYQKYYSN